MSDLGVVIVYCDQSRARSVHLVVLHVLLRFICKRVHFVQALPGVCARRSRARDNRARGSIGGPSVLVARSGVTLARIVSLGARGPDLLD